MHPMLFISHSQLIQTCVQIILSSFTEKRNLNCIYTTDNFNLIVVFTSYNCDMPDPTDSDRTGTDVHRGHLYKYIILLVFPHFLFNYSHSSIFIS